MSNISVSTDMMFTTDQVRGHLLRLCERVADARDYYVNNEKEKMRYSPSVIKSTMAVIEASEFKSMYKMKMDDITDDHVILELAEKTILMACPTALYESVRTQNDGSIRYYDKASTISKDGKTMVDMHGNTHFLTDLFCVRVSKFFDVLQGSLHEVYLNKVTNSQVEPHLTSVMRRNLLVMCDYVRYVQEFCHTNKQFSWKNDKITGVLSILKKTFCKHLTFRVAHLLDKEYLEGRIAELLTNDHVLLDVERSRILVRSDVGPRTSPRSNVRYVKKTDAVQYEDGHYVLKDHHGDVYRISKLYSVRLSRVKEMAHLLSSDGLLPEGDPKILNPTKGFNLD